MSKNVTPKFVNEYLDIIEKETDIDKKKALLKQYGTDTPLNMLLSLCYNTQVELELPKGTPPYKRDEVTHPDLFTSLAAAIKGLHVCRKGYQAKRHLKERKFISVMESINPAEGDILVACKDRALTELYPSITKELVQSVFPNYVG